MKAALCTTLDGPDAIRIMDIEEPVPGPGEVVVRVRAAGLNFFDTLISRGKYQYKPALPFSPAGEMAGEVAALGPGMTGLEVGDRVCGYLGWGCAREKVVAKAELLIRMPDAVTFEAAAGVNVTYGTAMHGLKDRGRLRPGETVAVLGASGGAGLAAVEVAKALGARVIAAASSADKLAICRRHGADDLVNYAEGDLKDALRGLTGGKGVDVVYDCVGGPYAEPALRATAWKGRFLVIGFAAGEIPKLPANLLLLRGCDAVGVFWGDAVTRDPAAHVAGMTEVLAWVAAGKLKPHVHATLPLERIGEAIGMLDKRTVTGKVIVTV
jgi:NADPH2:quinone reductase